MSPSLHWLHHSDNSNHYDSNFGMNFCFWDKMFGTYLDETNLQDMESKLLITMTFIPYMC